MPLLAKKLTEREYFIVSFSLFFVNIDHAAGHLLEGQNPNEEARKYISEHLYSALYGIQTTLKRSGMDHTVLPAINTMPAFTS